MTEDFLKNPYADKFSRHLIVIIPKVAFKDNSHVGAFVGEVFLKSIFSFLLPEKMVFLKCKLEGYVEHVSF